MRTRHAKQYSCKSRKTVDATGSVELLPKLTSKYLWMHVILSIVPKKQNLTLQCSFDCMDLQRTGKPL
jgi:hypothetical protein